MTLVLVLLLLLLLLDVISSIVINRLHANDNINVSNCSNSIIPISNVRHAIQTADRNLYLSLNHDWLDSLLISNKRINIQCITINQLQQKKTFKNDININDVHEDNEVIEIYYVPMNNSTNLQVTSYTSGPIDTFLMYNPCWIVLQEPDLFDDDEMIDKRIKHRLRNKPLIFVKLPTYGYGPTCKLFTHLTNRQFPDKCPDKGSLYYHFVQNYGFGGEVNKLVKTFLFNLYSSSSRVYAQTRHEGYEWLWANSDRISKYPCPSNMYQENPLACSFIPLSGCSVGDRKQPDTDWVEFEIIKFDDEKHLTLKHLGIDVNVLKKFRDGPGPFLKYYDDSKVFSAHLWVTLRIYAYVLRPNYRTRALIRKASKRIKTLTSNGLSKHSHVNHHIRLSTKDLQQCIGIHVRNHDVLSDYRNAVKLDRSLNAHIHAVKLLSLELSMDELFLATDNSTLYTIAPIEYPEFKWQAQIRTIKHQYAAALTHLNEDEPQIELANLLTDALHISKCNGLVGQSDSSLTFLYQVYNCNGMVRSSCSPFLDLLQFQDQGLLPYIGKQSRPDTIASFHYPWKI